MTLPRAAPVEPDANRRDDDEPQRREVKRACVQVAIVAGLILPVSTVSWLIRLALGLPPDTGLLERLFWGAWGVLVWNLVNHWAPALARRIVP